MRNQSRWFITPGLAALLSLLALPGCSPTEESSGLSTAEPSATGSTQPQPMISILDANQDGVLSPAEIEGAGRKLMYADRNGDGKLTLAEAEERAAKGGAGPKMPMYRNQVWGP